jgi:hypothetical protein
VIQRVGSFAGDALDDRGMVGDVERRRAGDVEFGNLVAARGEVGREVAADEPAGAGDERSHDNISP